MSSKVSIFDVDLLEWYNERNGPKKDVSNGYTNEKYLSYERYLVL